MLMPVTWAKWQWIPSLMLWKATKTWKWASHYLTIVGCSMEHLAYVTACHWILAPQLCHIFCCLSACFLIACWLNLVCPIMSTLGAPRQSTMCGNQHHLAIKYLLRGLNVKFLRWDWTLHSFNKDIQFYFSSLMASCPVDNCCCFRFRNHFCLTYTEWTCCLTVHSVCINWQRPKFQPFENLENIHTIHSITLHLSHFLRK